MFSVRITTIIMFILAFFIGQNAFCAENYKIKDIVVDSSDRMIFIKGTGNFKNNSNEVYISMPNTQNKSLNLINKINTFTISNPYRYVIDIPNAVLAGSSKTIKVNNSIIQTIQLSQFSANPNIVRVVLNVSNSSDLSKFKTYTNGTDIVIKYANQIIDNSIQYKFYTPSGDGDKSNGLQNTSYVVTQNNTGENVEFIPRLQTKYYLSKISQNSDGLILRGIGSISLERAQYFNDNTRATLILDNTSMSSKLDNKTYSIPSSQKDINTTLTINRINSRKVKLTLDGQYLRDYRFVVSPDAQSLFISHRSYIINTIFSSNTASANSYKLSKTQNGYRLFEIGFNQAVTYDVFELNDNFYLDINNLGNFDETKFNEMLKSSDIKIEAFKISSDKTRYIIPLKKLNFAYANIESNAKSIKLCFKEKTANSQNEIVIASSNPTPATPLPQENKIEGQSTSGNINVIYIPKEEDIKGENEKITKPKKKKDRTYISSMKKVVLDAGHGGADCGAIGGGYYEKNLNLIVTKLVQEKLLKKNVYVYMTRSKDETLTLEDRVNFSNEIDPDIYVSIHTNSTVQEDKYGLEVHYYKDDSLELAQTLHDNFASEKNLKKWETKDRGVIKSRFYVINHTEAPSILIEIGFLSNLEERTKLLTKDRQEEIADAIVKGILEYLKVK